MRSAGKKKKEKKRRASESHPPYLYPAVSEPYLIARIGQLSRLYVHFVTRTRTPTHPSPYNQPGSLPHAHRLQSSRCPRPVRVGQNTSESIRLTVLNSTLPQ